MDWVYDGNRVAVEVGMDEKRGINGLIDGISSALVTVLYGYLSWPLSGPFGRKKTDCIYTNKCSNDYI